MKRNFIFGSVALFLGGALFYFYGGHQAPAAQPPLASLTTQNLGNFTRSFDQAKDGVRLLVLLSPT